MTKNTNDWGERRILLAAVMLVLVAVLIAILGTSLISDMEFRKVIYNDAVNLFFVGLLGGLLKVLLDDVAALGESRRMQPLLSVMFSPISRAFTIRSREPESLSQLTNLWKFTPKKCGK
jgi:hypothetical protein